MATDIADLFAEDPLNHSDQDLDVIIGKFREMRSQFNLGAASAGSTKKIAAKAKQTLEQKLDLDLGDL